MDLSKYKFVVVKPQYGDVYNFCYKDLEGYENIDLLDGHIRFKSRLEEKIYYKHFTKKYNLPFKKIWNHRYYKNRFYRFNNVIFLITYLNEDICKSGIFKQIKKKYKDSKLILFFSDLIKTKLSERTFININKEFDTVISFDYNDCEKYGLYNHPLVYSSPKVLEDIKEDIDIYFCGKAKDRLDLIMKVFKYLKEKRIRCFFILSGVPLEKRENIDGIVYLDKFMSYEENIKYVKRSKCLLEIMQEGGNGYTLRTCEAVAYNKKILTNNLILKDADFYEESMISFFKDIEDIDISFINSEKGEFKDRHYFSPIKLLEKVVKIIEEKED